MSGKLNKEEQVQVVIRIKPAIGEPLHSKSVYLSQQQQKTLVVETPNKKEYFVFDNIADEDCTQQQLYEQIGKEALISSTQGFNCCIFAYGQTGSGKTHSILGATQQLATDIYSQSRGILPRLLGDLYSWCQAETDRWSIKYSYMEIYNQQIYDLLNTDQKLSQIREDIKKGVYVEGLSEQTASNYEQAMVVLMKGIKNRKVFATSMNSQSSRSHTIFTLNFQAEIKQGDTVKTRRSKINIVDLAGSERAKQTKVEGDRLKEGCNINKSLHVLGNVINALVQSSRKKKHIPFRDSKLTYFLKDSLCGNSVTKLLANIHPSKIYLGDTLSTLMFAKRAKILKMKVEANQNVGQNFEELRKQIRKLRSQLRQARYIKNQTKTQRANTERSNQDVYVQNWQRVVDTSGFQYSKHENALLVFEENQANYKALIQIYEQHMKICSSSEQNKRKSTNLHKQWKNLQKKNQKYKNLLQHIPGFTKIFKQNVQLRQQISNRNIPQKNPPNSPFKHDQRHFLDKNIKEQYQNLLKQVENKFIGFIQRLQTQYNQLEKQSKLKDQRIKQLLKKKQLPPNLYDLSEQNEYLRLSNMELENDLARMADKETKYQIQIKELKKNINNLGHRITASPYKNIEHYIEKDRHQISEFTENTTQGIFILPQQLQIKLNQISEQFQLEYNSFHNYRDEAQSYITKLKQCIVQQNQQKKQQTNIMQQLKTDNKNLKKKIGLLVKMQGGGGQIVVKKENSTKVSQAGDKIQINTFWTNEQSSNISEELEMLGVSKLQLLGIGKSPVKIQNMEKMQRALEKQQDVRQNLQRFIEQQNTKIMELSEQIESLIAQNNNMKCKQAETAKIV